MSTTALELRGLSHRYGTFRAVQDLSLEVAERDVFGFLGLNGAGKTTTLRLILGLIRPRAGDVFIFGRRGGGADPSLLGGVGALFEDYAPHPYLTGRQSIRMCAQLQGLRGSECRRATATWLGRVGLEPVADVRARRYSLGMKRRLGLACALVHSPRLVLLDEPTNGLDPRGIHELRDLVRELNREAGTTFLISSHILGEVEKVCNRVGIIHEGQLLKSGHTSALTGQGEPLVRVGLSKLEAGRAILEAADWCERLAVLPLERGERGDEPPGGVDAGARAEGLLEVRLTCPVARMVRELVNAGVDVFEVTPKVRSLEDVFRETVSGGSSSLEYETSTHSESK